ncbi:hypothetical protein D3C77_527970 [compost metagenome]
MTMRSCVRQLRRVTAFRRRGGSGSSTSNSSSDRRQTPQAKRSDMAWSSTGSIWTANRSAPAKASWRSDFTSRHHSTSGGSSDTEVKLLTVMPSGPSAVWAVTTQTPVAKPPSARR